MIPLQARAEQIVESNRNMIRASYASLEATRARIARSPNSLELVIEFYNKYALYTQYISDLIFARVLSDAALNAYSPRESYAIYLKYKATCMCCNQHKLFIIQQIIKTWPATSNLEFMQSISTIDRLRQINLGPKSYPEFIFYVQTLKTFLSKAATPAKVLSSF